MIVWLVIYCLQDSVSLLELEDWRVNSRPPLLSSFSQIDDELVIKFRFYPEDITLTYRLHTCIPVYMYFFFFVF